MNKKPKILPMKGWCMACIGEHTDYSNIKDCKCSCHTPSPEKWDWEEELKSYMVDLIDEYFPKDNENNPELQSTTHRSEAMASHSLFLIKFKEILSSQREEALAEGYDNRGKVEAIIKDTLIKEHKKELEKLREEILKDSYKKCSNGRTKDKDGRTMCEHTEWWLEQLHSQRKSVIEACIGIIDKIADKKYGYDCDGYGCTKDERFKEIKEIINRIKK